MKGNTKEFVIHVKGEHDYRLLSEHRDIIFEVLKLAYMSAARDNIPIFGIGKARSLADYVTTESDVSRGMSRIPLPLSRIHEEDTKFEKKAPSHEGSGKTFRISPSAMQREQLSESERFIVNLNDSIEKRNIAQRNSISIEKSLVKKTQGNRESLQLDSDLAFDAEQAGPDFDQAPQTLYRKSMHVNDRASWDDFELLSIIGRGTFGKVYLVRLKGTEKYFAMKVIRKDVVIKHESISSLQVEKLILNQVNHPFIIGMEYVF